MHPSVKLATVALTGMIGGVAGVSAIHTALPAATPHAYIVAQIDVHDATAYKSYAERAAKIVAQYGGHYLVRGGATKSIEGDAPPNRVAIIEFASMEALEKFESSPEYTAVKTIRQHAAASRIFAAEGVAP